MINQDATVEIDRFYNCPIEQVTDDDVKLAGQILKLRVNNGDKYLFRQVLYIVDDDEY